MYEIINSELRIKTCSIEDLTQDMKDMFVEQFGGDSIDTLTLFYNHHDDYIVLNKDNKMYDVYELTVLAYLTEDEENKKLIRQKGGKSFAETFCILDKAVNHRLKLEYDKAASEFEKMAGQNSIDVFLDNYHMIKALRKKAIEKYPIDEGFYDYGMFMYGYIQGIRAERARRKLPNKTHASEVMS